MTTPFRLGLIGHEQAKFTPKFTPHTEAAAKALIDEALDVLRPTALVSGHCPLGGVDIWAEEIAAKRGLEMIVHAPRSFTWNGAHGYKWRNLRIAQDSDLVLVVALRELPRGFTGMRFDRCYHCPESAPPHVKGGACWTAWKARERAWLYV